MGGGEGGSSEPPEPPLDRPLVINKLLCDFVSEARGLSSCTDTQTIQ